MFGFNWQWFYSDFASFWQQSICFVFIIISGMCKRLGRQNFVRAFIVFLSGLFITIFTIAVIPQNRVVFGILTLLGSCMIATDILKNIFVKIPCYVGTIISVILFSLFKFAADGFIALGSYKFFIPKELYRNYFTAWLGFPFEGFYSTDYFPIIPWAFLFWAGYFSIPILLNIKQIKKTLTIGWQPLSFLGKHSLLIYLVHQPTAYFLLNLFLDTAL